MSVSVLNTDAGLSAKTIDMLESDQTITGQKTFDRDPSAPFVVASGSAVVTNLDADKVDGFEATGLARLNASAQFTAGFIGSDTQPRCVVYNTTTQAIASSTPAALAFDTEDIDITGMHAGSNSTVVIPASGGGLYLCIAATSFLQGAAGSDGSFAISIRKNSTTNLKTHSRPQAVASVTQSIEVSALVVLSAADTIEAYVDPGGRAFTAGSTTAALASRLIVVKLW